MELLRDSKGGMWLRRVRGGMSPVDSSLVGYADVERRYGPLAPVDPPAVSSLADAPVGTVAKAIGRTYVRVRVSESEDDGWRLGWRSVDAEGWVSSSWLLKADAVIVSVPHEVGHV